MSGKAGPYNLDDKRKTLPCGELWIGSGAGGSVLVLMLDSSLDVDESALSAIAAASRQLESPFAKPWADHGIEDGRPWLAAGLSGDMSFSELAAADKKLDAVTTAQIVHQVALALDGEPHGALTGEFVRVSSDDNGYRAQVYGWGLASVLPAYSSTRKRQPFLGDPVYMAPEHCKGMPCSASGDVYAAGTMLYEGIRGRAPFAPTMKSATASTTLKRQIFEKPLALSLRYSKVAHIKPFQRLAFKALDKKTASRYADGAALAAALQALLTDEMGAAVIAPPEKTATTAPSPESAETVTDAAPASGAGAALGDGKASGPSAAKKRSATLFMAGAAKVEPDPEREPEAAPTANTGRPAKRSRKANKRHSTQPFGAMPATADPSEAPAQAARSQETLDSHPAVSRSSEVPDSATTPDARVASPDSAESEDWFATESSTVDYDEADDDEPFGASSTSPLIFIGVAAAVIVLVVLFVTGEPPAPQEPNTVATATKTDSRADARAWKTTPGRAATNTTSGAAADSATAAVREVSSAEDEAPVADAPAAASADASAMTGEASAAPDSASTTPDGGAVAQGGDSSTANAAKGPTDVANEGDEAKKKAEAASQEEEAKKKAAAAKAEAEDKARAEHAKRQLEADKKKADKTKKQDKRSEAQEAYARGSQAEARGDFKGAVKHYSRAYSLDGTYSAARAALARARAKKKKKADSKQAKKSKKTTASSVPPATKKDPAPAKKDPPPAKKDPPKTAAQNKAESGRLLKLGMGAYKNGRYSLAAKYFSKAKKLDSSNLLARKYLQQAKRQMQPK